MFIIVFVFEKLAFVKFILSYERNKPLFLGVNFWLGIAPTRKHLSVMWFQHTKFPSCNPQANQAPFYSIIQQTQIQKKGIFPLLINVFFLLFIKPVDEYTTESNEFPNLSWGFAKLMTAEPSIPIWLLLSVVSHKIKPSFWSNKWKWKDNTYLIHIFIPLCKKFCSNFLVSESNVCHWQQFPFFAP